MKKNIATTILGLAVIFCTHAASAMDQKYVSAVINGERKMVVLDQLDVGEGTFINSGDKLLNISCFQGGTVEGASQILLQEGETVLVQHGDQIKLFSCKAATPKN